MQNDQEEVPTASLGTWLLLIFIAAVSFWSQAIVTEERFVPALNVVATSVRMSDDVAGATLMAAGASSPELFSSIISLFVTHSALGLGTVFGASVFNQLITCAGAVYSSKTPGRLELNKTTVIREILFYAWGIVALFLALQDKEPVEDDPSGIDHIFINFWDALLVFGGYIIYVFVCANMDAVVKFMSSLLGNREELTPKDSSGAAAVPGYGAIRHGEIITGEDLPFLKEASGLIAEPVGNFKTVHYQRTKFGDQSTSYRVSAVADDSDDYNGMVGATAPTPANTSMGRSTAVIARRSPSFLEQSIRNNFGKFSDGTSLRPFRFLMTYEKPSDTHDLLDIEENSYEDSLSCFMWQRSFFYKGARFATHGWHLRWFSFMEDQVFSVPDRADAERHRLTYPAFTEIVTDSHRLVLKIVHPDHTKGDFYLMAPSLSVFEKVVKKLAEIMELRQKSKPAAAIAGSEASASKPEHDDLDFESLIDFPLGSSNMTVFFFVVLLPFRVLIHWTIPDVRTLNAQGVPNSSFATASLACLMCLVWMIVGSYAMVSSLEALAALLNIPDAVIGCTVSAAGNALPNYVGSVVAARNGFGNMAVSNALGSNTFNIMIGLGLPWLLYTSFATGFEPYSSLRNEGITDGVLILAAILLLFVLLLVQSGFVLYRWHGHLFVATYTAYLVYVIAGVSS